MRWHASEQSSTKLPASEDERQQQKQAHTPESTSERLSSNRGRWQILAVQPCDVLNFVAVARLVSLPFAQGVRNCNNETTWSAKVRVAKSALLTKIFKPQTQDLISERYAERNANSATTHRKNSAKLRTLEIRNEAARY